MREYLLLLLTVAAVASLGTSLSSCGGEPFRDTCQLDADCFEGYGCDMGGTQLCFPLCASDADCINSRVGDEREGPQTCRIEPDQSQGLCRDIDAE